MFLRIFAGLVFFGGGDEMKESYLCHFPSLSSGPHHKGVHGSFHAVGSSLCGGGGARAGGGRGASGAAAGVGRRRGRGRGMRLSGRLRMLRVLRVLRMLRVLGVLRGAVSTVHWVPAVAHVSSVSAR